MRKIILSGKAGSGKDYFRDYMADKAILDVSYTTRPARDGETPGYTYHYITTHQFENMVDGGNMHEAVAFNGWNYGTSRDSWENSDVFIMTPSGVNQVDALELQQCLVIYFDIDTETRRVRLNKRSDADSTDRRLAADDADFKGFDKYDIKVINPLFDPKKLLDLINFYSNCL